jgi:hypothetical protein
MKITPQKVKSFVASYRRNFLSFFAVLLSLLPVVILATCAMSFGFYLFNQQVRYLIVFFAALIGAPLLQTLSEHLEDFFEKYTKG